MIDAGYVQVGRSLGLPTHCYLGATDAKVVDAQAGMESGSARSSGRWRSDLISAQACSDFLLCQSARKLCRCRMDRMARRLLRGIDTPTDSLALDMFARAGLEGRSSSWRTLAAVPWRAAPALVRGRPLLAPAWLDEGAHDMSPGPRPVDELLASYRRPVIARRSRPPSSSAFARGGGGLTAAWRSRLIGSPGPRRATIPAVSRLLALGELGGGGRAQVDQRGADPATALRSR